MGSSPLLQVKELSVHFRTDRGIVRAVERASFDVQRGETVCIVGESGSGKSVTSLSIMGLLPKGIGEIKEGEILLNGENLVQKTNKEMRGLRGNDISMIFQEPMTSLNPVYTIGDQIAESFRYHQGIGKRAALERAIESLRRVGIPLPEERAFQYPHQLSGGMRQRVMIAMALTCNPELLIADEPTTALDVTIQAQVLEMMKELKEAYNMSILFITHDLGVVADMADRVVVMYAGIVVEEARVEEIFQRPLHPYTLGLLEAMPSLNSSGKRLRTIQGTLPNPLQKPSGCRFHPRCPFATDKCRLEEPSLENVGSDERKVACWHYDQLEEVI